MSEPYVYVGQTGTQAFDGFAGLRIGQTYQVTRGTEASGQVAVARPTAAPFIISEQQLAMWFRPA